MWYLVSFSLIFGRIFGIGQNVTSALTTVVIDIFEVFFSFVSFGVDFVVFLACLYYLLENEYSPLECVSLLMPVDLSKSEVVIESLTSSIKGIFQVRQLFFGSHVPDKSTKRETAHMHLII